MRAQNLATAPLWLFALGTTACSGPVDEPAAGTYRAVLQLPGGEAPFGLDVAIEQGHYILYLTNGNERTRVSDVRLENHELHAVFPGQRSTLRAQMHRRKLLGTVTLSTGAEPQSIPFSATLGDTYRFYEKPLTDNADVSGHWELMLTDAAGQTSRTLAVLEQQHDRVSGTLQTAGGEQAIEGQVHGDELQLSAFAGQLPLLYKLQVTAAGDLEGNCWQGVSAHCEVAAKRTEADASSQDEAAPIDPTSDPASAPLEP
jgi:hypothetical protein